jgi:hypothetical protein
MSDKLILIACRIFRGVFSGERVFEVSQAGGETYTGIAPVHYFLGPTGKPLAKDEPGDDGIDGKIIGVLVKNGGGTTRIAVPDGESIIVNNGQVSKRPRAKERNYVPV